MQADPARGGRLLTAADRALLRYVKKQARVAGLRVPIGVRLRVVDRIPGGAKARVNLRTRTITATAKHLDSEVLAHELAHIIADAITVRHSADHSRFWALVYGVLYQQVVQK